jgi:hypothetical protein
MDRNRQPGVNLIEHNVHTKDLDSGNMGVSCNKNLTLTQKAHAQSVMNCHTVAERHGLLFNTYCRI